MKREDVLAMDIDELNLAIAGSIFKAKVIGNDDDPMERLLIGWYGEEGWNPLSGERWQNAKWRLSDEEAWLDCPRYAEDMSAAWKVVELIANKPNWMLYRIRQTDENDQTQFECTFLEIHRGVSRSARSTSAPVACCKAALLAELEEEQE